MLKTPFDFPLSGGKERSSREVCFMHDEKYGENNTSHAQIVSLIKDLIRCIAAQRAV